MAGYVVETNVAIAANNRNCPQADAGCVLACIGALKECVAILKGERKGAIVLDARQEMLGEYRKHLSASGQPGAGDLYFKELFNRQGTTACEKVVLNPNEDRGYLEFPDDPALAHFDRSDRKFVAAARASQNNPVILNAVDSDWLEYETTLKKYVRVRQLCPDCIRRRQPGIKRHI